MSRALSIAWFVAALAVAAGCGTGPQPADAATGGDAADISPPPMDESAPDASLDARGDARADGATRPSYCTNGDAAPSYPPGPHELAERATLPDLRFVAEGGREVALRQFFEPCAPRSRVLVIRTVASWSGLARWHAEHTGLLRARPDASRIVLLDLLVLGPTNTPAAPRDLAPWAARYDARPDALAIDPAYTTLPIYGTPANFLPAFVFVDTRTMRVELSKPTETWDELSWDITRVLADLDGAPRPTRVREPLYDGRFGREEWDMIRAMTPVPAPPPDPTNAYADNPAAAALGRALFDDTRLSPTGRVSCGTCHQQDRAFADGQPVGMGVGTGARNTPSVLFAAHSRWQFWDGRADSLWSQALGPVENPLEMDSSRLFVAHAIARDHRAAYEAVFGPLPPLGDAARFPPAGRPGDAAWEGMTAADRDAVNRVFANFGKAVAAFERTLRVRPTALDAYAAGDTTALIDEQKRGLEQFFRSGCAQCHFGPLLTNDSFHNVWVPTALGAPGPDNGRLDAIAQLLASPFRADGAFSDAPGTREHLEGLAPVESMRGQFRTSSLRAVAATGPWGHGGTFTRLEDLMDHYARRSEPMPVPGTTGVQDRHLVRFHDSMVDDTARQLAVFMRVMTALPTM